MRIDAHHHLLDPGRRHYPWMTPELAPIARPWRAEDLEPHLGAAGIDATVLVQTVATEEESLELLATAADRPWIAGVVAWVDLTAPDVAARVAALRAAPGGDALVGVRHNLHDEADPRWILRPEVLRGLRTLADEGLVFDLLVRTRELEAATEAVGAVPELSFVLDHLGKPPLADGDLTAWGPRLRALADRPNVACKLSGLVTEASWDAWSVEDLRPAVDQAVGAFGAERLLFGSDWPVCELAADYATVHAAAAAVTDERDHDALFGGTAARVYGLDVPAGGWTVPSGASEPTASTPS